MSGRTVDAGLLAALQQAHVTAILLIQLDFASGTQYLCDAPFDVPWDGHTWLSAQGIGSIEPVTETDSQAQGLTFTLAAVNPAQIAGALTEMVQAHNRPVTLRLLVVGADGNLHQDPNVWSGSFDRPVLEDGAAPVIRITAEHDLIAWQQPSGRRFSHEDQQAAYPGDMFFQYAASLTEKTVRWPNKQFFEQ